MNTNDPQRLLHATDPGSDPAREHLITVIITASEELIPEQKSSRSLCSPRGALLLYEFDIELLYAAVRYVQ